MIKKVFIILVSGGLIHSMALAMPTGKHNKPCRNGKITKQQKVSFKAELQDVLPEMVLAKKEIRAAHKVYIVVASDMNSSEKQIEDSILNVVELSSKAKATNAMFVATAARSILAQSLSKKGVRCFSRITRNQLHKAMNFTLQ